MIDNLFLYIALALLLLSFSMKQKINKIFLYFLTCVFFTIILVNNFFDLIIVLLLNISFFLFLIFLAEELDNV
jgi:hypothetical protein